VIVIDCSDLDRSAQFWTSVLGYARDGPPGGPYQGLVLADGQGIEILLQRVPEVKSGRTGSTWIAGRPTRRGPGMSGEDKAMQPEDATRLVAERLNAGNAAGVAALYEPQAVLAYPADRPVTGRDAIQALYQQLAGAGVKFAIETPLPTVRFENLALTSTRSADNTGVRVQVLRQQPDGSWLRIIDRPEVPQP
jgi:ketosteroid isomerase-like protein